MKLGLKMLMVLGLTLAILVPLMMIRGTINERQLYRNQAVATVARSYAGVQGIAGPALVVPYVDIVEVEDKNAQGVVIRKVKRDGAAGQWTFFPDSLDIDGKLKPSTRRLGLHEVRVYELDATLAARFSVRIPADADPALPRRIGQPYLSYGVADVRGLVGSPRLRINNTDTALRQGLGARDGAGVHVRLPIPVAGDALTLDTRFEFALGGTESLAIAPLARRNHVALQSSWPHPQFNGAFLPRSKDISDQGFRATWEVSSLATNAQAQYLGGQRMPSSSSRTLDDGEGGTSTGLDAIGLSLVEPVNVYSQADRASKYGLLFVGLTFVGFFMFELIKQLRIHPIQYMLVGLALAIFFLLLVSLSEHIAFGWAYLIASAACIGLLAFYLSAVLHGIWRALGFATMLSTLYGALYGLLVSEDNALVLGAGLLFVILATIMVVTRKVDWYRAAVA